MVVKDREYYNKVLLEHMPKIKAIYPTISKISKISLGNNNVKRWLCVLYFSDGTKKHTQVARVLLEASLGRVLDKKETVDHIDGDALNNSLDNLQMLSLSDNAKKGPRFDIKMRGIELWKQSFGYNKGETHPLFGRPNVLSCGANHRLAKLSNNDVIDLRKLTYSKEMISSMALKYNCSEKTISNAYNKLTYVNV